MAENICMICHETFTTAMGHPPDPPICDDCLMYVVWGEPNPNQAVAEAATAVDELDDEFDDEDVDFDDDEDIDFDDDDLIHDDEDCLL